jgi:hypothetical protein
MPRGIELLGRDAVVGRAAHTLAAGHSVLLFGPDGIGKSAIVAAIPGEHTVLDPFGPISRQAAARIRRALDRGTVYLAAARSTDRRALGAVGRILWRFRMIRVRELPATVLSRIVATELRRSLSDIRSTDVWVHGVVAQAQGRPGFAVAMARFAVEWHRRHGHLPMPAFVFAAAREEAAIRSLVSASVRSTARARERS